MIKIQRGRGLWYINGKCLWRFSWGHWFLTRAHVLLMSILIVLAAFAVLGLCAGYIALLIWQPEWTLGLSVVALLLGTLEFMSREWEKIN